ncbi:MAG TPA: hypothetical protein VFM18_06675 [Methanosarcina sp.]|nr:hypothetical protein [Methanosarcina sp.]
MKCPNCGYEHGWHTNEKSGKYQKHEGSEGDFYSITNGIHAVRDENMLVEKRRDIFGCPSCGSIFIDV